MVDAKTIVTYTSKFKNSVITRLKEAGVYEALENDMMIKDMGRMYNQYLTTQALADQAQFEYDHELAMKYHRTSLSYYKQVQDSLKNLGITLNQRIQRNEAQQAGQDSLAAMREGLK